MATTTIAGALVTTTGVAALVSAIAVLAPATAEAQDYTSGAVAITVTDANGKTVPGATVTLVSKAQGVTKTLTASANGVATATGLTPGDYDVTVTANGYDTYKGTANVVVSQEVTYTYSLNTAGAATTVTVTGHRVRQDFNKTTQGLNVDLTTLSAQEPIARTITAVTLLAPTTVKSDAFGVPTIGGSSAAENAYYINGLNITNPDTYVGGSAVPFDFYKTVDVQTSGYSAEFGRATGGVVNATTKSGTNTFMFAVHGNSSPNSLRSKTWDLLESGEPAKYQTSDNNSLSIESGGALIKDKLFLYGLVQLNDIRSTYADMDNGFYQKASSKDPFYGLKGDWYITPGQHLELTYFNTTATEHDTRYNYTGDAEDGSDGVIGSEITNGKRTIKTGGQNWVAKYTGNITDWFTVSAAYGDTKDSDDITPENTSLNYVRRYNYDKAAYERLSTTQPYTALSTDDTERKFWRLDGDLRFEAMGKHHIRFGLDNEDLSMNKIDKLVGDEPVQYQYYYSGGAYIKYARTLYEALGGTVSGKDSAGYIQDSWDVTPTLNLQIGLRDDEFKQTNLSGQQYLDLKGNWAPRLGFSWKPSADSNWRFTGSYGQYYIPPAMNLGYRGKDNYYYETFAYPAGGLQIDPTTGLPTTTLGDPTTVSIYNSPCPTSNLSSAPGIPATAGGANACVVYGAAYQEPANAKAAVGLKATRETEYTLAANYRVNDLWSGGISVVYRNLDRVSEDTDFAPEIVDYCTNVLHVDCADPYAGNTYGYGGSLPEYHVWNVGDSVTIKTFHILPDGKNEQEVITLTGLGFPKPKRTYTGVTFNFKRDFDGKWGLQGSYTWSRSYGNYEGTTYTFGGGDTGQTDAGSTQLDDYLHLSDYSTGILPNNRTHEFKLWGSYAITPNFLVGANILVQSPQSLSCMGTYPDPNDAASGYGAASHYCDGKPAPMGTGGKTDWTKNIDLSLRYTVPSRFALGGKLVLRGDIFNLFDNKQITGRDMDFDLGDASNDYNTNYYVPTSYGPPRTVRIGFDLNY